MKYLNLLFLIVLSNLCSAQKVSGDFDFPVYREDFDDPNPIWEQKYTGTELFQTEEGVYRARRLSTTSFSAILPKFDKQLSTFQLETSLSLSKSKNREHSAGVLLMVQPDATGAIIIEINNSKGYRIRKIVQGQLSFPFGQEKKNYWVKAGALRKKGRNNEIVVRSDQQYFDLYFNGKYIRSFAEPGFTSGGFGLYVNADSEAKYDYINITSTNDGIKEKPPAESSPFETNGDANDLQEIVLLFKTKIDKQQKEIETLEAKLWKCQNTPVIDTFTQTRNRELEAENIDMREELREIKAELREKRQRLEYLESVKEDIEQSSNGDIILNLTQLLADEKKKNRALRQEIERLKRNMTQPEP